MLKRLLVTLTLIFSGAFVFQTAHVNAQSCNDPSGFVKLFGTIDIGDVLVLGPDCQKATSGGPNLSGLTVTNIAALRALNGTPPNVYVTGYYTAGDGGGGWFAWDNASTASDNGGTVIRPNTLPATGRYLRAASETAAGISVLMFGAKCNGAQNDLPFFQAAADFLPQGTNGAFGGTILIPFANQTFASGGGCILSGTWVLSSKYNIVLKGTGSKSVNGSTSLIYYTAAGARGVDGRDTHGLTIDGVAIAYTSSSFTGTLVDVGGLTPSQPVPPCVSSCFGSLADGFVMRNSRLYATFSPGTAKLLGLTQTQNCHIENNYFLGGKPAIQGPAVLQGSSTSCNFVGNTFINHVGVAVDGCGDTWQFFGNNIFEPNNAGAQAAFGNTALIPCRGLEINGAWMGDSGATLSTAIQFIGTGLMIKGGRISMGNTSTVVKILGTSSGISIVGLNADAATLIDFNSQAVTGVSVKQVTSLLAGTVYANAGGVTGFTDSEGNSPSLSRLGNGQIIIGQPSGDAVPRTPSQDCTLTSAGVFTCTRTNNVAFGPYATASQGQLPGIATNTAATAGNIGEILSTVVNSGAAVIVSASGSPQNVMSLAVTAGEWDMSCTLYYFINGGAPTISRAGASISSSSGAFQTSPGQFYDNAFSAFTPPSSIVASVPVWRVSLAATTTYYCVLYAVVSAPANFSVYGILRATRVH